MTATTVFTAPDLSCPDKLSDSFEVFRQALAEGQRLLNMAALMRREADQAAQDRTDMKQEYRTRRGSADGSAVDQAIDDHRLGAFKIMGDAKADNLWYMRRASMYSNEAAAHFAKASAIMSYIAAQRGR